MGRKILNPQQIYLDWIQFQGAAWLWFIDSCTAMEVAEAFGWCCINIASVWEPNRMQSRSMISTMSRQQNTRAGLVSCGFVDLWMALRWSAVFSTPITQVYMWGTSCCLPSFYWIVSLKEPKLYLAQCILRVMVTIANTEIKHRYKFDMQIHANPNLWKV